MDIETKNSLGSLNRRLNEIEQELFNFRLLGDRINALEILTLKAMEEIHNADKKVGMKTRYEGWINIYQQPNGWYNVSGIVAHTEKEAMLRRVNVVGGVTIKITWED